jgi:hypothetical protein
VSLCRASRVCCRRGVKFLPRGSTTEFHIWFGRFLLLCRKVVAFKVSRCFPPHDQGLCLHQPRVAHSRDTISVLGPLREARDTLCTSVWSSSYHICGPLPARARWRVRDSPASLMARGCDGSKATILRLQTHDSCIWHGSFRRSSRTLKRAPRARVCNSLKLGLSVMNEVIKYHTAHIMLPRIHL